MTPSPPPAKPSPLAVAVTPPRSGSGVSNFHTPPARRHVDRADRAVVLPACERRAERAVREAEVDVAEKELALLLGRAQPVLDQDSRRFGGRVEDVVRLGVVGGRRVVQAADRAGEDRDGLPGLERRMLDPVDHLDALVERLTRSRRRTRTRCLPSSRRRPRGGAGRRWSCCRRAAAGRRRTPTGCCGSARATTSSGRRSG